MDDWELDAEETTARAAQLFSATTGGPPVPSKGVSKKNEEPASDRERREAEEEREKVKLAQDLFSTAEKAVDLSDAPVLEGPTKLVKTLQVVSQSNPAESALCFNTVADCQKSLEIISPKIINSQAKSVAMLELLLGLLKVCAPKMTEKDLMTISNKAKDIKKQLEMESRLSSQSAKKIYSGGKDQIKNYKNELDMMYGDCSDDDEEEDDDDDFM